MRIEGEDRRTCERRRGQKSVGIEGQEDKERKVDHGKEKESEERKGEFRR